MLHVVHHRVTPSIKFFITHFFHLDRVRQRGLKVFHLEVDQSCALSIIAGCPKAVLEILGAHREQRNWVRSDQ